MRNITVTEWDGEKSTIDLGLRKRWPWLCRIGLDYMVHVECEAMSASIDLRRDDDHLVVKVLVGRSCTITGGPAEVAEAARQICEVRDAMLYIHGRVSDLSVWPDGQCPCSHCSGRGTSCGSPCRRCEGRGLR